MTAQTQAAPEPRRILIIDIIRGFALFGILLVNTPSLNTPVYMDTEDFGFQSSLMDHRVTKFIFTFAMESFYPIFALLFGIGAAIFLSKRGSTVPKLYVRRMFFLFLIGLLHACLVWWGDILIVYSVIGICLLAFYDQRPARILLAASAILLTAWAMSIGQAWFSLPELPSAVGPDTLLTYSTGSFAEISLQRMHDYIQAFFLNDRPLDLVAYYLDMLGIMLLGMWVHKQKILSNMGFMGVTSIVSLMITIMCVQSDYLFNIKPGLLGPIKGLSNAIFYVSLVVLASRTRLGFWLLKPLAYNGRMSMTNYLGFNICLSLIFYGYGLGLYGSMGPASQMPIVVVLYCAFLAFSALWLRRFPYGPFEWLWRLATYGRIPRSTAPILMSSPDQLSSSPPIREKQT